MGSAIDYNEADKTKIKKIKLQLNFDPGASRAECQNQLFDIWLDNLQIVMKDNNDLLETGIVGPYVGYNNTNYATAEGNYVKA